jgi:Ran GTPase-activating protein (RanGAP) involved in mRNA processing and transport
LLPALAKKDISSLSFKSNKLGCDEISSLATFVRSNNTLESLEISGSTLNSQRPVNLLSTSICKSRSLKLLKIEKCGIGQNVSILCDIVKTINHLSTVYLSGNDIGSNGAMIISDILAKTPPITELYLNDNELTDNDVVPIAQALRSNSNLRRLYLRNNLLTRVGDIILSKALWDNTSFITACMSNHTCRVYLKQNGSYHG